VSRSRFTAAAAEALRAAIAEAGGIEVFAVGDVDEQGHVSHVEVHARGTEDAVLALRSRARSGQVVIHNHPSGTLRPSEPDTQLAGHFGEDGVGFVIVDNRVERAQWVVEPMKRKEVPVDDAALADFFERALPAALPGWEPRPGQLAMARSVARSLGEGGVLVLEAGTGTGKSLAYLAPAALWALANDKKVVVSTFTKTLQGQLVGDDLPMLAKVLPVRFAVLKGRNNYVCRRKLEGAVRTPGVEAIAAWAAASTSGDVGEIGFEVNDDDWDAVESDSDQTLRARCPHFNACFYYQARRAAAAAHLIVVNHALLLADLQVKQLNDNNGILPRFDRVVLDEAHHLEAAATLATQCRVSAGTYTRAIGPLVGRPGKRMGALDRIGTRWEKAAVAVTEAHLAASALRDLARVGYEALAGEHEVPVRVTDAPPRAEFFEELVDRTERVAARLGAVQAALEGEEIKVDEAQPLLDLTRARRRLEEASAGIRVFLNPEEEARCRFLDPGQRGIAAAHAPVDVAPTVRKLLADGLRTTVLTSATLAVNGRIEHYLQRTGLEGAGFETFPSPFDYREQAILALPKDLPAPDAPGWLDAVSSVIVEAIDASRGGAFVLCTSHAAVNQLADRAQAALGTRHAILRQGKGAKGRLLQHFREDRGAVLFGTDSFWEGVSVRGEGLRLVIIPRLPFRVPTEPIAQARYERMKQSGHDPFRAYALPEAVLKLRQGFGRLVRAGSDRGAVLVLDRRLHEMWYGRVFLASLPDARRVVGPTRAVVAQLREFYGRWFSRAGSS
jgi:ATP-dependent DNA helicase DinG